MKCSEIVLLFSSFTVSAFLHCFSSEVFSYLVSIFTVFFFNFAPYSCFRSNLSIIYFSWFIFCIFWILQSFMNTLRVYYHFIFFILYKILFFLSFSSPYPFVQFFKSNFFFLRMTCLSLLFKNENLVCSKKKCENVKL